MIKLAAEDKRKKEQKIAHDLLELIIWSTENRKRKQIIIYLTDGEKDYIDSNLKLLRMKLLKLKLQGPN